jgi:hypothetical protein
MDDYGGNLSVPTDENYPPDADHTFRQGVDSPMGNYGGGVSFTPGTREVAGIVYQPDGMTLATGYTVRLYDRATGELRAETTSDGTTAEFSFTLLDDSVVYLVAVDQVADTWRAPLIDLIVPLEP